MGAFVSRQPNGKLCRYSSIVDAVTHYNMTDEEYIQYRMEKAAEEARFDLEHHLKPWDYMVENINSEFTHMTRKEKDKVLEAAQQNEDNIT